MKRVIVTGATGFVGSNLVRRLLRDGHEVHLLVRPAWQPWRIEEIVGEVRMHEADLGQESDLLRVISMIRPDWVFHLAASGGYSHQTDLQRMIQTNFIGTVNLIQASVKVGIEAFVNAGSSSEYGFKDHAPTEDEYLEPNSHYAVTKSAATLFGEHTGRTLNVRITTLRLYSVYGPFEEPTRLIPSLVLYGMRGDYPPLVNPEVARDFVHVEDVSSAFVQAASHEAGKPGAVFNTGTGVQTTLREAVAQARQVFGIEREPIWGSMPNRSWDTSVWVCDNRRIREELGWSPTLSFARGFGNFVDWLQGRPQMAEIYSRVAGGRA